MYEWVSDRLDNDNDVKDQHQIVHRAIREMAAVF